MLIITAISSAVLAMLQVMLSLQVVGIRRKHNVSVGDGGEESLLRAIRAQANLTEYAPIALIMLACLEFNGASVWLCGLLAVLFVGGRLLHPVGMKLNAEVSLRVKGMQLTLWSLIALAVSNVLWLLWLLIFGS